MLRVHGLHIAAHASAPTLPRFGLPPLEFGYTTPAGKPTPRAIPVAANTMSTSNTVWITL